MNTLDLIKELNSPTKIIILCWILKQKEITVGELVKKTGLKRVNISKQVCELYDIGTLCRKKVGTHNHYYLNPFLDSWLVNLIKSTVNSYHIIDENKGEEYEPYK